jgi:hypothetical protein
MSETAHGPVDEIGAFERQEWFGAKAELRWTKTQLGKLSRECRVLATYTVVLAAVSGVLAATAITNGSTLWWLLTVGSAISCALVLTYFGFSVFDHGIARKRVERAAAVLDHLQPPGERTRLAGFVIARIEERNDDTEAPQLYGFSEDVLTSYEAADQRLQMANDWRTGWHMYALREIR